MHMRREKITQRNKSTIYTTTRIARASQISWKARLHSGMYGMEKRDNVPQFRHNLEVTRNIENSKIPVGNKRNKGK